VLNIDCAIKEVEANKSLTGWEVEEVILDLILSEVGMAIPDKSTKEYDQLKQIVEIANGMDFDMGKCLFWADE